MKVINLLLFNIIILIIILIIFFVIDDKVLYKNILLILTSITILINSFVYSLKIKETYKSDKFLFMNIDKNLLSKTIYDHDTFKIYIYTNYCQCISQCLNMDKYMNPQSIKPQPICSKIMITNDNKESSYDNDILFALNYLIKNNILIRSGKKFYIKSNNNLNLKLRWENIKLSENFNNSDKNETQELLWLLRKLVVDALLKKILLKYSKPGEAFCDIYSVGSTNVTSDYDVSLYGNDDNKVIIINEFQKLFKKYFTEDSSIVFDTNIYGKSYIYYGENSKFSPDIIVESNNTTPNFYYMKFNIENKDNINLNPKSQLMWGIIKFLKDLSEGFDEKIYNEYTQWLQEKLDFYIFDQATYTLKFLLNQDEEQINESSIMSKAKQIGSIYNTNIIKSYKDNNIDKESINQNIDILIEHDIIALVSFYGLETYYTRGAFLDIVVNQQMLSKQTEYIIQLSDIEYITSILENAGFYLVHNTKSKYIIRVVKTLKKLNSLINEDTLQNNKDKLQNNKGKLQKNQDDLINIINLFNINKDTNIETFVEDTKSYCSFIKNTNNEIDISNCHKYKIFNIIFDLVYNILEYIKQKFIDKNDNTEYIAFYDLLVKQENDIFKLLNDNEKPTFFNNLKKKVIFKKNRVQPLRNVNSSVFGLIVP
jgi:hypothetical protein